MLGKKKEEIYEEVKKEIIDDIRTEFKKWLITTDEVNPQIEKMILEAFDKAFVEFFIQMEYYKAVQKPVEKHVKNYQEELRILQKEALKEYLHEINYKPGDLDD